MQTAGINIAALARRTGVAPDTLRKWEQRYAILRPHRTPGGQRRYDEQDVARVEWLSARLREGLRIGEAAALLGPRVDDEAADGDLHEALLQGIRRLDAPGVGRLLDRAFAVHPTEVVLDEVVAPALERVGDAWAAGELSVAQEHLFSSQVRSRLERLLADERGPVRGTAVLACAPGERHELGLMMLAVLLRADGWHAVYLGADTPVADAVDLAGTLGARLLCVSAAQHGPAEELAGRLGTSPAPERLDVVLGGAAMDERRARRAGGRYVDGDLRAAVRSLREPVGVPA